MAALRHGISTVISPFDNLRDLEEIDQTVRNSLNFVAAKSIDTVLQTALVGQSSVDSPILADMAGDMKQRNRKPTIRQ